MFHLSEYGSDSHWHFRLALRRNGGSGFIQPVFPRNANSSLSRGKFNSIEINGSFYSLQDVSSWQRWYAETPEDFVFSVKGGRFITHMKKLKDIEKPLANFFAQGVLALKEKLRPIL
jgi:uncharacterized protein YecE (DUF72 family)